MALIRLLLFVLFVGGAAATTLEGKVIAVADGDTITILDANKRQHKIRLAQIDAPEKSQAFGNQSKKSLSGLVFSKPVKVVQEDIDRYRRIVGRVYLGKTDINAEQVKRGMAWVYRKYARDKSLFALENNARTARKGLWTDPHAIPPWEYRKASRGRHAIRNTGR